MPMKQLYALRAAALALAVVALLFALPQIVRASITSTFYGITIHVSSQNIKVEDTRTKQVMSFLILPKFDQVFSADGKTTYQMSKVKAGQYVAWCTTARRWAKPTPTRSICSTTPTNASARSNLNLAARKAFVEAPRPVLEA